MHWSIGALAAAAGGGALAGAPACDCALFADETLARYGFPAGHPFGTDRQAAFLRAAEREGLLAGVARPAGREATEAELLRFHGADYLRLVRTAVERGLEMLDAGDTPVFPGVYPVSAHVVGSALEALAAVMGGRYRRSFQPIGGLHHASPDAAAGFCVFSDLGVVIETLRSRYGLRRIAYVDIDVHHGDGVFYPYEADPDLIIADVHQHHSTLYPGTGKESETGKGEAAGTKLNVELAPGEGDEAFLAAWPRIEAHLAGFEPELFLFQCGADGGAGDPLAQLEYTPAVHARAAERLRALAERFAGGRILAFGGGGYDRDNLAQAWSEVLRVWRA